MIVSMSSETDTPSFEQVRGLVTEHYVPFAEIERAIPWPRSEGRMENDAEHSWNLAFVACAVAERLGLDVGAVAQKAVVHDFVERFAGDTSVWDDEGTITKHDRELQALAKIRRELGHFPWIAETIEVYERLETEEDCLVYALDKLMAVTMIVEGDGYFWRSNKITFEDHLEKLKTVRPKITKHATVLGWYDAICNEVERRKEELFHSE